MGENEERKNVPCLSFHLFIETVSAASPDSASGAILLTRPIYCWSFVLPSPSFLQQPPFTRSWV